MLVHASSYGLWRKCTEEREVSALVRYLNRSRIHTRHGNLSSNRSLDNAGHAAWV